MKYYLKLFGSVITLSAFAAYIHLSISTGSVVRHLLDIWWLNFSWMLINLVLHLLFFPKSAWQVQEETAWYHQATTIRQILELLAGGNEFSPISYVLTSITICLQIVGIETDDVKLSQSEAVYFANYIGLFFTTFFCALTYISRMIVAAEISAYLAQNTDTTVEKKPTTQGLSFADFLSTDGEESTDEEYDFTDEEYYFSDEEYYYNDEEYDFSDEEYETTDEEYLILEEHEERIEGNVEADLNNNELPPIDLNNNDI